MTSVKRHQSSISRIIPRMTTIVLAAIFASIGLAQVAYAQTLNVLYSFTGVEDGGQPYAQLVSDDVNNAYGTTAVGGDLSSCGGTGCGVVFRIQRSGGYKVLYAFTGGTDGANPWSGLLRDASGNLYGTTEAGGAFGFGTVFKIGPSGRKTILYNFAGGTDGAYPFGALITDGAGNLYGTTYKGGASSAGTVFKVSAAGETVLYSFKGGTDGQNPYAGLIRDAAGNLYGTTFGDGIVTHGTVFRLTPSGKETVLHVFTGGSDGGFPYYGSLVTDAGDLYGTTSFGGAHSYFGTIFKVDRTGLFSVVYSFTGGPDGGQPDASLIRDAAGNLYGVTVGGGDFGHGVIFKFDTGGVETALYSFAGGTDPASANAPLFMDRAGNLYGTSVGGGVSGNGTIFQLTP
ncbi:MAG TPA: choice-of-anchor tandem repeat GloVer-containing protein [Terriglobales bacterium]|jgi:uncharacterized repeat protein (TIGR03803 family)|nr:choice-of-anchor tandem repeat GloVer-containing protein [Terriglobales bacterium]